VPPQVGNAEFLELLRQVPTMTKHMQLNSGDQHDKYIEGVNNMKDLAQKIRQLEEALISIQPAILVRPPKCYASRVYIESLSKFYSSATYLGMHICCFVRSLHDMSFGLLNAIANGCKTQQWLTE
jgi:hypothetical protein